MVSSTTLNSHGNNIPRLFLSLVLCLLLILLDHHCLFVLQLLLNLGKQHGLCFLRGQAGNALQLRLLLLVQLIDGSLALFQLGFLGGNGLLLLFHGVQLAVKIFLLGDQTPLLPLQLIAAVTGFTI